MNEVSSNTKLQAVLTHTAADYCRYSYSDSILKDISIIETLLPSSYYIPYFKAQIYQEKLDYESIKSNLEKSIKLYPRFKYALEDLGLLYTWSFDYDKAEIYLKKALYESDPDSTYLFYNPNEENLNRLYTSPEKFRQNTALMKEYHLVNMYAVSCQFDKLRTIINGMEPANISDSLLASSRVRYIDQVKAATGLKPVHAKHGKKIRIIRPALYYTFYTIFYPIRLAFSYEKNIYKDRFRYNPLLSSEDFVKYCIENRKGSNLDSLAALYFEEEILSHKYSYISGKEMSVVKSYTRYLEESGRHEQAFELYKKVTDKHIAHKFLRPERKDNLATMALRMLNEKGDDEKAREYLYKCLCHIHTTYNKTKLQPMVFDYKYAEVFYKLGDADKAERIYEDIHMSFILINNIAGKGKKYSLNWLYEKKLYFHEYDPDFYYSYAEFLTEHKKDSRKALELLREFRRLYNKKNEKIETMYNKLKKAI